MICRVVVLFLFASGVASGVSAQQTEPLNRSFLTGARTCISTLQGKLALNPPSDAQTTAGLVLADPAGADDLKPFADLSPSARLFAAVTASNGKVVVAHDPSQGLCRVVVMEVTDISPVTAAVGPLGGDWVVKSDDPVQDIAVFQGTFLGSTPMTIRVRKPPAGSTAYGAAKYMLSLKLVR